MKEILGKERVMLELKDPAIKLFGKTISLPSNDDVLDTSADVDAEHSPDQTILCSSSSSQDKNRVDKNSSPKEHGDAKQEDRFSSLSLEEFKESITSSAISDTPTTPYADKEAKSSNSKKEDSGETSTSQEKTLKKPDKILPCPRCNSMDTKFCYFNNYNVNQPRHFCKNCQRYWTAGGTMRNVPVGAGRRKNKSSSAAHHQHIVIPDVFHTPRLDSANGFIHQVLRTNGTILVVSSDMPLCESMASALNLADKSPNCFRNGFAELEPQIHISCGGSRNGINHPSCGSNSSSNPVGKGSNGAVQVQEAAMNNIPGFPPQVPCFPAPPWSYPWDSAVPPSPFLPSGFPMSSYAAPPYWGCGVPGSWNAPWLTPPAISPDHSSTCSSPNSPTLGKHSREGIVLKPSNEKGEAAAENRTTGRVLVPKTLRIDDPNEAAKSSIWATLGINNDRSDSMNSGGLFKGFQPKAGNKNPATQKSLLLQANPAALSRSLTFQESAP
ncbi:hypothetical protein Ancab_018811 [Ancistrocladus abbreviatus]